MRFFGLEAYLKYARQALERGALVLAGALADPVDGAVLVFRGPSPEPAEAFASTALAGSCAIGWGFAGSL